LHHGEELVVGLRLPFVVKVNFLEFGNENREGKGLYAGAISADPISIVGVFDSCKDLADLFLCRDVFVIEVAFAALDVIVHDSSVEIP
jgi:hypothetical protein